MDKMSCCFLDMCDVKAIALDPVSPPCPGSPSLQTGLPAASLCCQELRTEVEGRMICYFSLPGMRHGIPRETLQINLADNNMIYERRQFLREGCNLLEQHWAIGMTSRIPVAVL